MKRHSIYAPSIALALAFALALLGFASPSRAANPAGNGGDAGADDGSAQYDADADAESSAPEGIQPTTTPDNLNCAMRVSRGGTDRAFDPVGGLGALGVAMMAVARRRRAAQHRRSS